MQRIVPHLWFDKEAREAADFYVDAFGRGSRILHVRTLKGTPSGDADAVAFEIAGFEFQAISAGPFFRPSPSVSFFVNFYPSRGEDAAALDALWERLIDGGTALMPLQEYPFSKRYGWVQDRFGVSWQLMLAGPEDEERPFVVPSLMFTGEVAGKAEEATGFYMSLLPEARRGTLARYPAGSEPDAEGTVMYTDFTLAGQWLAAMDSAQPHGFAFTEGISLIVRCADQAEMDRLYEALSAVPEAEQCGWVKDRYGLSWQVLPESMDAMFREGTDEQVARMVAAFMPMKRLDVAAIERAYRG